MATKKEAQGLLREIVNSYYQGINMAPSQGKKVAWCTGISPSEFLIANDFVTVFPENHAALVGARKLGLQLAEVSEEWGYSEDICSYARIDIGNVISGQGPLGHLPKPDLLLCCNDTCTTVIKWYENLARHFDIPLFLVDIPFVHGHHLREGSIQYIIEQLKELIGLIASITGKPFDYNRFLETVDNSNKTSNLWGEILDLTKRKAVPFTAFDAFNFMTPIVTMRGTKEALEFYRQIKKMLGEQESGITDYKYKIIWDGIPLWFELRGVSQLLRSMEMVVVCSTYTSSWVLPLDVSNPFESMATALSNVILNRNLDFKKQVLLDLVSQFNVDGIIHHSNRSCKPSAFGLYQISKELVEETGVQSIIIDGDQCDARNFSMAQFETRIGAFRETLALSKFN